MRQAQSRRTFLGVGLACSAPLLLKTPLVSAASRVLSPGQGTSGDAVLDHLKGEALRNYRRTRAALAETGRIPGEQLRTIGANLGLLDAFLAGRGEDGRLDEHLRRRLQQDGVGATVAKLTEAYRALREKVEAQDRVVMPSEPDFSTAAVALDGIQARGFRGTTRLLRRWVEAEARRADRAAARPAVKAAAYRQKPGDDFGGYPEPDLSGMSCQEVGVLLAAWELIAAILACTGNALPAGILAVVLAAGELLHRALCLPMAE